MKTWYMTAKSPDACSGYEDDLINNYAQANFNDILLTEFSDKIILYNHDLSISKELNVIIQGKTGETKLKTIQRTILCPIGTLKAGMYVYYNSSFWLVTGMPDNNKSYEKSTLELCNWKLKWMNSDGKIISRWAIVASASKYNDGTNSDRIIIMGSDQISIQTTLDSETINLMRGTKFIIDYNTKNPTVYEVTNPANVIYHYSDDNGITNWIAKECAYSFTDKELEEGVCNYRDIKDDSPTDNDFYCADIIGNNSIKIGYPRNYEILFYDKDKVALKSVPAFAWKINADFLDKIKVTYKSDDSKSNGVILTISIDDKTLIDKTFVIDIIIDTLVICSKTLSIKNLY